MAREYQGIVRQDKDFLTNAPNQQLMITPWKICPAYAPGEKNVTVKKNVVWPYSGPFTNSWATDSEGRQAVHEPPPSCVAVSPTQAVRESITDTAPTGGLAVGPDTKRTSPVAASEESAAAQTIANAVVR